MGQTDGARLVITAGLAEFFYMGGKGIYVWPAYAAFVVVLAADIISSRVRAKSLIQAIRDRQDKTDT